MSAFAAKAIALERASERRMAERWDSNPVSPCRICNLQILNCPRCRKCQGCRGALLVFTRRRRRSRIDRFPSSRVTGFPRDPASCPSGRTLSTPHGRVRAPMLARGLLQTSVAHDIVAFERGKMRAESAVESLCLKTAWGLGNPRILTRPVPSIPSRPFICSTARVQAGRRVPPSIAVFAGPAQSGHGRRHVVDGG